METNNYAWDRNYIFVKNCQKKTEKPKTHVPSSSQLLSWSIVMIIWSQCEVEHLPTLQNPPHLFPGNVAATHRPDRLRMATIRAEQALAMDARSIHSWALTCWRHRYIEICWCHLSIVSMFEVLGYGLFKGGRCLAACINPVLHVSSAACQATWRVPLLKPPEKRGLRSCWAWRSDYPPWN